MQKLDPRPTRHDLTDRECASIITGTLGPLAMMTDVETLRRTVRWIADNEDIWKGFARIDETVDEMKTILKSKLDGAGGPVLVYRPRSSEEVAAREQRALAYRDPFIHSGQEGGQDSILGMTQTGKLITLGMVEMAYNDRRLFNFISDGGKYGPTFDEMVTDQDTRDVLEIARKIYADY